MGQGGVREIVLANNFRTVAEMARAIGAQASPEILAAVERGIAEELQSIEFYPETLRVLEWAKERGYKIGLISNLASPYKEPFFTRGLNKFFDTVIFSCDCGLAKPDRRIFELALFMLRVSPDEALMVGDSERADLFGPREIGMFSVLLDRKGGKKGAEKISSLEDIKDVLNIVRP
jgi:HAD superfamily hydrolase (TIGR01549 family)